MSYIIARYSGSYIHFGETHYVHYQEGLALIATDGGPLRCLINDFYSCCSCLR
jgi:hypothetical protein